MSDLEKLRKALKIDNDDFQDGAAEAQRKFKAFILQLMSEAQDDTDRSAILGGLCAAYISSLLLFKPDDMDGGEVIASAMNSIWVTGMQMLELDEESLLTLKRREE